MTSSVLNCKTFLCFVEQEIPWGGPAFCMCTFGRLYKGVRIATYPPPHQLKAPLHRFSIITRSC